MPSEKCNTFIKSDSCLQINCMPIYIITLKTAMLYLLVINANLDIL